MAPNVTEIKDITKIDSENKEYYSLAGELIIKNLSENRYPHQDLFKSYKEVSLGKLTNIDSAGIAYLALIKSHNKNINFIEIPNKVSTLSDLYGLNKILGLEG